MLVDSRQVKCIPALRILCSEAGLIGEKAPHALGSSRGGRTRESKRHVSRRVAHIDWFHNRFSPPATSWGHSKCRGRLARDGPSPRIAAVRLGPWVQSEAPRLSLGRGGEPRAHSVPRSRIFPRPHSSDIADTTLPHALTLLLLGYSSETWWQSRLASSTRRFAQVSRQALPPLAASPARSRSALRRDTQPRELTHAD